MRFRVELYFRIKKLSAFVAPYAAPVIVLALIIGSIVLDYAYRQVPRRPYDKGMSDLNAGRVDAAIADFNAALRQNPDDLSAKMQLALAYQAKGWYDEALAEYEQIGPVALNFAHVAYHNAALVYLQKGQTGKAESALRAAMRADPGARNTFDLFAARHPESARTYRRALDLLAAP